MKLNYLNNLWGLVCVIKAQINAPALLAINGFKVYIKAKLNRPGAL